MNSYNGKPPTQSGNQNPDDFIFQGRIKNENPKFDAFTQSYSGGLPETILKEKNPSEMDYRPQNQNILIGNNMQPSSNLLEMNQGYIKYAPNLQNIPICIPVQMNQSYNNQMPFNNIIDPNKTQGKPNPMPILYQYPNANNYAQLRNNNNLNMYIAQNSQNIGNNYELVPNYNYVLSPNGNNSFQVLQVGMALRPVSNVLVIPQERIQALPRNNVQYPSYVFYPVNNNLGNQKGEDPNRNKESSFN